MADGSSAADQTQSSVPTGVWGAPGALPRTSWISSAVRRPQAADVAAYRRDEAFELPDDLDYAAITGLSNEARHKLQIHRPRTIGHAGRIDGMTPAALTLVAAHLRRNGKRAAVKG